jgi:hypothetical protein
MGAFASVIVIMLRIDAVDEFLTFAVSQNGEMGSALNRPKASGDRGPDR